MNLFIFFFCCIAVAATSGAIIKQYPSGIVDANNKFLIYITDHLDNTWGQHANEEIHDEELENWSEEAHDDWKNEEHENGQWKPKEDEQLNEDGSWDTQHKKLNEEEEKWIEKEEEWVKEQIVRHRVKRQEGRWNKELERYEVTSQKSDSGPLDNDNSFDNSPFGLPPWGQGF